MKDAVDASNWRNDTLRCVTDGLHVGQSYAGRPAPPRIEKPAALEKPGPDSQKAKAPFESIEARALTVTVTTGRSPRVLDAKAQPVRIPDSYGLPTGLAGDLASGSSLQPSFDNDHLLKLFAASREIARLNDRRIVIREGVGPLSPGGYEVYTIIVPQADFARAKGQFTIQFDGKALPQLPF